MSKERRQFLASAVFAGLIAIGGLMVATQYGAARLGYHRALGTGLMRSGKVTVYPPWACIDWSRRLQKRVPSTIATVDAIAAASGLAAFLIFMWAVSRLKARPASTSHGSARWADRRDLEKAGLLDDAGVVLCQTDDARYTSRPDGKGTLRWRMARAGKLIRHAGPEHVLVFAPTRSGKGVGTVIPTLFSWEASAVIYDIKKELWAETAGWRRKFSHCWRFEPTADGGVKYNPLFEIRQGRNEVRDAQTVAEILIDPDGKPEKDHWKISGASLLTAVILHVLYAEADKSLRGVSAFLSDPSRTQIETLKRMLTHPHLPGGPHPVIAQTARAMISKSDNELSGVVSTAKAALTLYDDEIVAENTGSSDFCIADLMNAEHPVSLYLVVPPSDIDRTRPLIRLMLQQFGKRLTEKLDSRPGETAYKHRLLMLLDEFPTLGRLTFFETALAFAAGYGIKCFLICQSLNQLDKAYGRDNAIVDNCHVRMAYAANRPETAKTISELVGQSTASKRQRSLSGRGLIGARSVSESEQEFARQLLTPDEVLRLPYEDAILMVGGLAAYRARKVMYFLDRRFAYRAREARLAAPDSPTEQRAELVGRGQTEWELRKPSAAEDEAHLPESPISATGLLPVPGAPPTLPRSPSTTAGWSEYFDSSAESHSDSSPESGEPVEAPAEQASQRPGALPL